MRRVRFVYLYDSERIFLGSVVLGNVKGNGCAVEHIAVGSLHLNELIALIVHKHFGRNQIALAVGIECVDCQIRGIRNGHCDQSIIGCINLESCSFVGDGLSCFSIHLNHLEIGFKNIIVNDEAVRFGVVANIYIEIIDIVTTFPSVGLMHGISAVGQLL